jgi:hypothetical protein
MVDWYQSFVTWLADQVRSRGFWSGVGVVITLFTVAVGLGLVTDTQRLLDVALTGLVAVLFLSVVALWLSRVQLQRDLGRRSRTLDRYAEKLTVRQRLNLELFETTEWREEITISSGGDARIRRWFKVVVGGSEALDAFWSVQSSHNNGPPSPKVRGKIEMRAYSYDFDTGVYGAPFDVDLRWETPHQCKAFVFFDREVPQSREIGIFVEWRWPRHFEDFARGAAEPFRWSFRLKAARLESDVFIDGGVAPGGVLLTNMPGDPMAKAARRPDGSTHVRFILDAPQQNHVYQYTLAISDRVL